jgi:hypothetical protein
MISAIRLKAVSESGASRRISWSSLREEMPSRSAGLSGSRRRSQKFWFTNSIRPSSVTRRMPKGRFAKIEYSRSRMARRSSSAFRKRSSLSRRAHTGARLLRTPPHDHDTRMKTVLIGGVESRLAGTPGRRIGRGPPSRRRPGPPVPDPGFPRPPSTAAKAMSASHQMLEVMP